MKDWFSIFGVVRAYSAVNTQKGNNCPSTSRRRQSSFAIRRKSSIFVNQFFKETGPPKERKTRPRCAFVLMAIGVLSIVLGLLVCFIQPYDLIFKLKVQFTPGGETFELWRKPPVDIYLRVWLFNVTNRDEFLAGKEKLKVKETGPYVYRELLEHSNVTFNDNGTVTAVPRHPLVWVPELSAGKEDDILILPNIALLSISEVVKDMSYFTRLGMNVLIHQTDSKPLVAMTAHEFMFGYTSTLVTLGNKVMPSWIHFDKLGLIDRMYDFEGDISTVFTGEVNVKTSGLIDTYNGNQNLPHWEGEHCSRVSGASDATKFPSLIDPSDTLLFYRKSVCRAMPQVNSGNISYVGGLKAFDYRFIDNALDNGAVIPENKCFCRHGKCLPAGLIDVTECYYGFPIAVSYPHFYQGDPALVEAVEGSYPDKEKHESYFLIEPSSGLPLDVAVRFQINMALNDISSISRVSKFKNMVLPMLWTEIRMSGLPEDLNNRFILYLNVMPVVQDVLMYAAFIGGGIFLLGSMVRVLFLNWDLRKKSDNMDFSRGNSEELKRIHKLRRESQRDILATSKEKELEAYYSSLLAPQQEKEENEDGKEMDLYSSSPLIREEAEGEEGKSTTKINIVAEDSEQNSCDSNNESGSTSDVPDIPPPQYDLLNFLTSPEAVV